MPGENGEHRREFTDAHHTGATANFGDERRGKRRHRADLEKDRRVRGPLMKEYRVDLLAG